MSNTKYNIGLIIITIAVLAIPAIRANQTFDLSKYSETDFIAPEYRKMPLTEISGSSAFLKIEEFKQFFNDENDVYQSLLNQLKNSNNSTNKHWDRLLSKYESLEEDSAKLYLIRELFELCDSTFLSYKPGETHSKTYFLAKSNSEEINLETDTVYSFQFYLEKQNNYPLPKITNIKNVDLFLNETYKRINNK